MGQEDAFLERDEDIEDVKDEPYHEFTLPETEYGEDMFSRRLAPGGSSSPPYVFQRGRGSRGRRGRRTGSIGRIRRGSTVDDTEEGVFNPHHGNGTCPLS